MHFRSHHLLLFALVSGNAIASIATTTTRTEETNVTAPAGKHHEQQEEKGGAANTADILAEGVSSHRVITLLRLRNTFKRSFYRARFI